MRAEAEGLKALSGGCRVVEARGSGDGDTRDLATRSFFVEVDSFEDGPDLAAWRLVGIGKAHHLYPHLYSARAIIEKRINNDTYRVRIEYVPGVLEPL